MTYNVNRFILALLVLIGLPFYVLLLDNRPGNAVPKPVHIATLRQLAASIPGPAPTGVKVETIATLYMIGDMPAAGSGLKLQKLACFAWALPVPGRGPVLIDATQTNKCVDLFGMDNVAPAAMARIAAAQAQASASLQTHDHNLGGADGAAKTPPAQDSTPRQSPAHLPTEPLANTNWAKAVAPGVVVVSDPVHALGHKLIYVRLANGRELLFTGGISALSANWSYLRARSRLLSYYLGDQNRPETYAWLLTIRQLASEARKLLVIPGHDSDWVSGQIASGTIAEHFPAAPKQ